MTMPIADRRWRAAHDLAARLRAALTMLGVPATEVATLSVRADATGAPMVVLPPLRAAAAERLLTGLGPMLGPHGPHGDRWRPPAGR